MHVFYYPILELYDMYRFVLTTYIAYFYTELVNKRTLNISQHSKNSTSNKKC